MEKIEVIIGRIIEKVSYNERYQFVWLERNWRNIVGESMNNHCFPSYLQQRVLNVKVDSSVWNQALFIEKQNIIQQINQRFFRSIIDDIRLSVFDGKKTSF